jgi:hypothetical protein
LSPLMRMPRKTITPRTAEPIIREERQEQPTIVAALVM